MSTKVEKCIGRITLQNTVDITDPVYNKTVWCRLNSVPVISGDYNVYITKSNEGEFGQRISELKIISNQLPFDNGFICSDVGEIGVDSGLAGFWADKPDFDESKWSEFCSVIEMRNYLLGDSFVYCTTGYGDGSYPVTGIKVNDVYFALKIQFI